MKPEKNDATVLLRLPAELKAALTREAIANDRRITAEINLRLSNSLKTDRQLHYPGAARVTPLHAREPEAGGHLSDMQRAMLRVFDRLPPEKQLALLSLFK